MAAQLQPLVDIAASRLPPWCANLLTRGGRTILVQTTLCAIPIHAMMSLDIPPKILDALRKICRAFLWKGRQEVKCGHCLVAWDKVASPKSLGGLGIPNLRLLNLALCCRWAWLKKSDPSRPWADFDIQLPSLCTAIFELATANDLSGNIPASLGKCEQLDMLSLSSNSLQGTIPSELTNSTTLLGLDLSNNYLTGSMPLQIGALLQLLQLDISFNNLSGQVPFSLGRCVQLSSLRLRSNMLTGYIPQSFGDLKSIGPIPTGGIFQNHSAVILDGNVELCESAATTLFQFPVCATTETKHKQVHATMRTMKKVSYGDMVKATNWFSSVNKISSSRTGSVYIGRFEFDTDLVAIKVFHLEENGAHSSFLTECEVLRNTRHRNVVKAITVCSTVDLENNGFKAIVFDFMANGSLDMWVHQKLHQNSPKGC
ncbi:hypothetical protein ACQ4PT_010987 [Festuca glaucescens]